MKKAGCGELGTGQDGDERGAEVEWLAGRRSSNQFELIIPRDDEIFRLITKVELDER